ncbi:MAG: nucleotide exchange factor GrpE [Clostridia bacterium]|nr:nucleotide exchange factor GrpE [Clostridia bacterium]MBQ8566841.1 nucleotide exchange factor GrpE [Clostridia bacterium]
MEEKDLNKEEATAEEKAEEVKADPVEEANKRAYDAEKKCAETNDKYLRIMAEYDNFRKRTAKERDFIYSEAYSDAIKQLLPVIDNIERSVTFVSDEETKKGLNMIITQMTEALNKMGVTVIETKEFDPNVHNAVMHVDDEAYGEGEIVEVFQKGYKYKDKIIRYAMVKVAN